MSQVFREGDLVFQFPNGLPVERLDRQGEPIPHGMSLTDLVIEETQRAILVEVKDPGANVAPPRRRDDFVREMLRNTLIHEALVPKARDSYAYLHLMARDAKPFLYVVVLGLDPVRLDPALLIAFKDRLLKRLRQETDQPWRRHYVSDCLVLSVEGWNLHFPYYPLQREPTA